MFIWLNLNAIFYWTVYWGCQDQVPTFTFITPSSSFKYARGLKLKKSKIKKKDKQVKDAGIVLSGVAIVQSAPTLPYSVHK